MLSGRLSATGERSVKDVAQKTIANMKIDRVNVAAGAFAFRWFLAIFPIIIALLGIASLVAFPSRVVVDLIHGVSKSLPPAAAQVFAKALKHTATRTASDLWATIIASVVALWSATSGMVIVEEGLDMAYGVSADRSFLSKRLRALSLLAGATVLGGGASALVIFGAPIGHLIRDSSTTAGPAFGTVWTTLRWLIALGLINLLFTLLYWFAPNRPRRRWQWTSVGSLLGTLLWAVISLGFSFYTSSFGSYTKTYGAFAGVAILIFWLYLTGLAILVGGEVNAVIEVLSISPHDREPSNPSVTPAKNGESLGD